MIDTLEAAGNTPGAFIAGAVTVFVLMVLHKFSILPVKEKTYLVFPGMVVYAAKKDVMEIDGIDRKAVSAFIKENKIRWKDPQSLQVLMDYLSSIL